MKVLDLHIKEYHTFYETYINKVPKGIALITSFIKGKQDVVNFFKSIPIDKLEYRYEVDKWSIKEVFQHIIDNERVFMYRCFRIARYDKTPLAGYDQDDYTAPSKANKKSLEDLIEEYLSIRQSFIVLLKNCEDGDLKHIGEVNKTKMSARAAAFITIGHEIHHMEVIKARYL